MSNVTPATVNSLTMNRPIHLARRDALFEQAVEAMMRPLDEIPTEQRLAHVERVRALLRSAEHHAHLAARAAVASELEKDFARFLRLFAHNVQSVAAMIQHQAELEGEQSFLTRFLGASPEECVLPAMHYQRRAEDLLQGLWHLLRLAHVPYQRLRQETDAAMAKDDRARYLTAVESFRREAG